MWCTYIRDIWAYSYQYEGSMFNHVERCAQTMPTPTMTQVDQPNEPKSHILLRTLLLYFTFGTLAGGVQPGFFDVVFFVLPFVDDVSTELLCSDIKLCRKLLKFLFVSLSRVSSDSLLDFGSSKSSGSSLMSCLL